MAKKKRILETHEPILHEDHKRPVTRREFLNAGFITSAASVMLPGFATSLISQQAKAFTTIGADCGGGASGDGVPFICFDLGGGANMLGSNILVGNETGDVTAISSAGYSKMGVPAGMTPAADPTVVNTELGIRIHSDSAFLRGILSKTTADTRSRVNGAVIPARSDNDTGNNPHNPMYGIARAGATGTLSTLIGTSNSDSGGRSVAPPSMIDMTLRPTRVSNPNEARGLVDTGAVSELMTDPEEAGRIMEAAERISLAKIDGETTDSVPRDPLPDNTSITVQELVHCGYQKTTNTVQTFGSPDAVDPRVDPLIRGATDPAPISNLTDDLAVIGNAVQGTAIAPTTGILTQDEIDNNGKLRSTASVMKLVLGSGTITTPVDSWAGAGTVAFGGYDYHNGTRGTGERRDFEAGQAIGATLEYAARKGKKVMVYVFTDGSLASNGNIDDNDDNGRGKSEWTGDNSSVSAAFFFAYSPNARPQLKDQTTTRAGVNKTALQHQQIGYMRSNASVETNATPGANNVTALAEMCVLNWMALNGVTGPTGWENFPNLFPGHNLGETELLERWIAFEPLT